MRTIVVCPNGHALRVQERHAGQKVRCPRCLSLVAVPSSLDTQGVPAAETLPPDGLGPVDVPDPSPPAAEAGRPRGPRRWPWLLAGAAAVLAAAGVFAARRGPEPPPGEPPARAGGAGPSTQGAPEPPDAAARREDYPRIPGAAPRPPDWLLAEAPFDLRRYFQVVPEEENAAGPYLEALAEFGAELARCFPEAQRDALRERGLKRNADLNRLWEAWNADRKGVRPADTDALLAEFEPGFRKIAAAQRRKRCAFYTGYSFSSLLPHLQSVRQANQALLLRTARCLERGDFAGAVDTLESVLRLNRDIRHRGGAICQLVANASDGEALRSVKEVLNAPGCAEGHCDRLLALLGDHAARKPDAWGNLVACEYVLARTAVRDIEHRSGDFSEEGVRKLGGNSVGAVFARFANAGPRSAEDIDTMIGLMSASDFAREAAAIDEFFRAALEVEWRPYPRGVAALEQLGATRGAKITLRFLVPDLNKHLLANARADAELQGVRCLVALRRWQLGHAGPPPDLGTVVKAAGMPDVPADPFSGDPMKMAVLDGEPVVYSVGKDGRDDGALIDWNNGQQPGDYIFRLAPKAP
jgi:hypothetical protein